MGIAGSESVSKLRADALACFQAGLAAADPARAVERAAGDAEEAIARDLGTGGAARVVAFGKAACSMARAAGEFLSSRGFRWSGLAVTNPENRTGVAGFRVLSSSHPLPSAAGVDAAKEVARFVSTGSERDVLLVLISGGGSAILPAPADGITLEDKVAATELLLTSGASIGEVNTIRKHLSCLKGGALARLARASRIETWILSDVIGDDLSTIASGPTAPDPTTFADARRVLEARGIWEKVPGSVRRRIEAGVRRDVAETPKPGDPVFERVHNRLAGSNGQSLDAAAEEASRRGYRAHIASRALVGEAREAARELAVRFLDELRGAREGGATRGEPLAVLAGGETTVTVRGPGRGGRNQELALAFAVAARELDPPLPWPYAFLSAGTDGIDGPTDAAGALVDPGTISRGEAAGLSPEQALRENDSYPFLERAGGLLKTGATGTNVADLQVLVAAPALGC